MKKTIRGFVVSTLIMMLLFTTVYGANSQKIDAILNGLNISVNGEQIAKSGESYTLSNGTKVPYSINYAGTTYLPMKKVAELLNKDVEYVKETKTAKIMDKPGAQLLPPITVWSELTCFDDGTSEIAYSLFNLSDKDIASYTLNVFCFDKDLNPAKYKDSNRNIAVIEGKDAEFVNNEQAEKFISLKDWKYTENYDLVVAEVTFTDGTVWSKY